MSDQQTQQGTTEIKFGFAEMFKGGVIMDVVTPDQARVAEAAGATAVMALERVPADIRRDGGVARMSDPSMIKEIIAAVSIPVMAKVRIGHFVEAQILQALGVDFIDESEVLTPADESFHIDKLKFKVPFVNGAKNLGEALRRVAEGASMIRTKGEAGTGDVVEAVRHARAILGEIRAIRVRPFEELMSVARDLGTPYHLVQYVHAHGKLPVVNFAAGGIATPADAALMMQLGLDGVFVGSGIFKSGGGDLQKIEQRARAIVRATTHFDNPDILAEVSENLGLPMTGINIDSLIPEERLASRGW
ncbi:pyridoxal 5'-phosphate synthase lyase subunit PdxS [Deinococcus sp.]|uniref:pyridoxal 5'-phosphate synthase lyase subunit PdxS n=1 Tax=Deinococcus sp. TaxID=47478 RepID=UPI0025E99F49|nr:pyridoxal 5'-phosphate synthase lyase subunit PdxS [Deinococcus sp.]